MKNILAIFLGILLTVAVSFGSAKLEKKLEGEWTLKSLSCNGVSQVLEKMDYTLTFHGKRGAYVSKTDNCTQIEPEIYGYPTDTSVTIKSGVRRCNPTPCKADLEASECGKETNPAMPTFQVEFKNPKTFVLSTSDSRSVDCIGKGQSKPAVFTFTKK